MSLLIMVVVILPVIALIIMSSFEKHMHSSIKKELSAYSFSILAVAEVEENTLLMPEALIENQFNISDSGLYAFISKPFHPQNYPDRDFIVSEALLWSSQSALTLNLSEYLSNKSTENLSGEKERAGLSLVTGEALFSNIMLNGSPHFIYSYAVSFPEEGRDFPLIVHIVSDKKAFLTLISDFKQQLWFGLAVLMVIVLLFQLIWLTWTLKPLSILQQEVKAVEQGVAEKLTSVYPKELAQLTSQVNQLLTTEQKQRQRYRNALSDLAHSLKTPLAVLQAQNDISAVNQEQINRIKSTIDHQLKRAQSAGSASWVLGIAVNPVIDKLLNTLAKIYFADKKSLTLKAQENLVFKGDEADLLELVGNLLDNAYKAAKSSILLTVNKRDGALVFCIEDDGVGINQGKISQILERGIRADTYDEGHGVGLAIVRDLVESYQGDLQISNAKNLSGASFTIRFNDMG